MCASLGFGVTYSLLAAAETPNCDKELRARRDDEFRDDNECLLRRRRRVALRYSQAPATSLLASWSILPGW